MRTVHEQFVDDVLGHFFDNLKLNDAIACAADVTSDPRGVIDLIYPLMTRRTQPDLRHLYAAIADYRLLTSVLEFVSAGLSRLQSWTPVSIHQVLVESANTCEANFNKVRAVVSICILFGPSPLDLVRSMHLLGQEESWKRCENVAEMIRSAHRVS
jgi:hypothetical protein